ncbi:SMI1/KNR4 family protein [Nocardia sp. 2YAB30]|uniref:SMI1/KNR4 family protein n=1 Tax=unclassified Nocardia TaxID=2637762 RepID=UPI003F99DA66
MAAFEEVMASFWDYTFDTGVQEPLTDEAVREAEELLGVTLPESLLRLLRVRNGGSVGDRWNAVPLDCPDGDGEWSDPGEKYEQFDMLRGIGHRDEDDSILLTPYLVREWELPSPIVLLDGDGHYWIALDYRNSGPHGEPSVALFDSEDGASRLLAVDFESFVEKLTAAEDFWAEEDAR